MKDLAHGSDQLPRAPESGIAKALWSRALDLISELRTECLSELQGEAVIQLKRPSWEIGSEAPSGAGQFNRGCLNRKGAETGALHDRTQKEVSIAMRISVAPVHRGHDHIESLAGGRKVDLELASFLREPANAGKEVLSVFSNEETVVAWKERVSIELYKQPVRPAFDRYPSADPAIETSQVESVLGINY